MLKEDSSLETVSHLMVCFSPVLQMVLESGEVTLRARAPEARARRVREETILKLGFWYYRSGKLNRFVSE